MTSILQRNFFVKFLFPDSLILLNIFFAELHAAQDKANGGQGIDVRIVLRWQSVANNAADVESPLCFVMFFDLCPHLSRPVRFVKSSFMQNVSRVHSQEFSLFC